MNLIINHSSMVPIYEQMMVQIKSMIMNGELHSDDVLPSVRSLAKELRISALTVKKAYDLLEEEGYTVTVHGKGTYVAAAITERMIEEQKREIELELEQTIQKGIRYGLKCQDIRELFGIVMEEYERKEESI